MTNAAKPLIVAGHICLDLIPTFEERETAAAGEMFRPGTLVKVGPAVISTGGAVANTGLALHKLGYPVRLAGSVGADTFGDAIRGLLRERAETLEASMMTAREGATSYTVVLSPPGLDRMFLHHPGTNDTFRVEDIPDEQLRGTCLLHFGYPTLMRQVFLDGGRGLRNLLERAKAAGAATSLDVSMPDPESEAGRVDWRAFFREVLPAVDVFLPSYDELSFMLDGKAGLGREPDGNRLRDVAERLLDAGVAAAAVKLGDQGLYLRTASDPARFAWVERLGGQPGQWAGRELHAACFRTEVAGTTGAGDCTIAGFLGALTSGQGPEETLRFASAVGAFNVEAPDATGGIRPRAEVLDRVAKGWDNLPCHLELQDWREASTSGLRRGPRDTTPP